MERALCRIYAGSPDTVFRQLFSSNIGCIGLTDQGLIGITHWYGVANWDFWDNPDDSPQLYNGAKVLAQQQSCPLTVFPAQQRPAQWRLIGLIGINPMLTSCIVPAYWATEDTTRKYWKVFPRWPCSSSENQMNCSCMGPSGESAGKLLIPPGHWRPTVTPQYGVSSFSWEEHPPATNFCHKSTSFLLRLFS